MMKLLFILIVLIGFTSGNGHVADNIHDIRPILRNLFYQSLLLDCSQYANDDAISKSFPFVVQFNSTHTNSLKTYGTKNDSGDIESLNIINEEYVPAAMFCLKNLRKLSVRNTRFHEFNHRLLIIIERLASKVSHLTIRDTFTTHLPPQISYLKHLEELELIRTGLTMLPDSIDSLSSLTLLDLQVNNLTSLPLTITNMPKLRQLILNGNPHLQSVQSLNGHSSLKILHTDNCPIERIPRNLPQLTDLYMSYNSLTNLYGIETIGDQTNGAKSFYFANNKIRYLSPNIRRVKNLEFLNLDNNQLYSLPMDILHIPTLRYLHVENNYLRREDLQELATKFSVTHPKLKFNCSSQKIRSNP